MNTEKSKKAFEEAKKYIPGGVNSPVRAFKNVGTYPLFIARAKGSKIYDIDGNEFIDFVGSWVRRRLCRRCVWHGDIREGILS